MANETMSGANWHGHMTIGGLPSPRSLTGFLRYLKNVSQRWPVSWMAPTYSCGQEMVSIYLIKIKITTKFFKFVFGCRNERKTLCSVENWFLENICIVLIRDGSVPKMCTSGGRQSKTAPILGLHILLHPNQTWTFPVNDIAIKISKRTKFVIIMYIFF